ncbi:SET and MYND domain-containing protein 4 [Toxorhynchites rutilus septentrionalis]|uniref:SET and MYND domain-containing protein 4 n=1 Tax=Toxorhynchites rutilus septentrionalis TaxID=329112 RepID=UPI002478379F|nr:SET and MYND domain-containing protein 4 [Toxorhynchites rutilus septentrionalis]
MAKNGWDVTALRIVEKYNILGSIQKYESEVETIRKLDAIPQVSKLCRIWLEKLPKVRTDNDEKSHQYREKGNQSLRVRQNPHDAVEKYTCAIFSAPPNSVALALAHANRGMVLMTVKKYHEAFDDCQLALNGAYPEENRLRVLFRQAECALQLRDRDALEIILAEISNRSQQKELATYEMERLKTLQKYSTMIAISEESVDPVSIEINTPVLEEKSDVSHGRFMVTKERIEKDSPIVQEESVSFIPVYDVSSCDNLPQFDCQYCATVNVVPFPCSACGGACYCSIKCREAHVPIHQFECPGYEKHLWYLIGIAHLGMRCFLDGFESSMQKIATVDQCTPEKMFEHLLKTVETEQESYPYGKVLGLLTNIEHMDLTDMVLYSMTAYMLGTYLSEYTMIFNHLREKENMMSKNDWTLYFAAVIFRHIGQLICNGHGITDLRWTGISEKSRLEAKSCDIKAGFLHVSFESARVFTGIFPRVSMFNHSCNPNIRNHFSNNVLTVYATRDIEPGGEIFNSYGPSYKLMDRKSRRSALRQQYSFDCECTECVLGNDEAYEMYEQFKCPFSKCGKCFMVEKNCDPFERDIKCPLCKRIIDCSCFQVIASALSSDSNTSYGDFVKSLDAYEKCKKILSQYHESKITLLHMLFLQYLPFSGLDERCLEALKKLAHEFVTLREQRFGIMSPEYVVGCFYLLDLLVVESKSDGVFQIDSKSEQVVHNFKKALDIFGKGTRAMLLNYIKNHLNSNAVA